MKLTLLVQFLTLSVLSSNVVAQSPQPRKSPPASSQEPINIIIGEDDVSRPPSRPAPRNREVEPDEDTAQEEVNREKVQNVIDQKLQSADPLDRNLAKMMQDFIKNIDSELQSAAAITREIETTSLKDLDSQSKLRAYMNRLQQHAGKLQNVETELVKFQSELRRKLEQAGLRGDDLDNAEGKLKGSTNALLARVRAVGLYPDAIAILDKNWGAWEPDPANPSQVKFDKKVPEEEIARFNAILTAVNQAAGGAKQ